MKKTALLLYPQFSEYEISVALSVLMQGRKPVVTIGVENKQIRGESGLTVIPDTTIYDLDPSEFDSLLLSGCMDISQIIDDTRYTDFIKRFVNEDTIVASISSSPALLAKAGVLIGKKYTVGLPKEMIHSLPYFEPKNYSSELIMIDDNMITARGRAFVSFGNAFGNALQLQFDLNWYKE
ncbi:4-methyl-5(B-hydroxyethyl)-thiazole monophosphate biosynthesis protein [Bacillus sp. BGMRC 2118]|nr:4-methyl-5(B-hydroxyethyl)-thiazole monophosphate biosynthesis protein [Bacillus sp. BGMRC 2118]